MTAEQKQYTDFVSSLNRDAVFGKTTHLIMLAAADSDLSTEYHWKRRARHTEWAKPDGNDKRYSFAPAEAAVKIDEGPTLYFACPGPVLMLTCERGRPHESG